MMYIFVLMSALCVTIISCVDDEYFIVNTPVGQIRGTRGTDGDYIQFLGIPYGVLNNSNPFGTSQPHPSFEGVFNATDGSAVCPQYYNHNVVGTIDCLHLHVYIPTKILAGSSEKLPVMVWIHGGAFIRGSGSKATAGPKYLIRHDVILVSINYRLGPYGFMCLDIPEVPGNQGMKDQLIALRWINDNIEAFGGDVNKITVFGESAGGHGIDLHLISSEELLYNNIILQSGSSLASTVIFDPEKEAPIKISNYLGYQTEDVNEALGYISGIDAHEVIRAERALDIMFKPCVEKVFDGVKAFLTSHWVDAKVPNAKDLSILTGFNDNEMIMTHVNGDDEYFRNLQIFNSHLKLSFDFDDEYQKTMERSVRNFYVGDAELNQDMKWDIINFDSDFTYIHPIHRSIKKYTEAEAKDIFFYKFSYSGGRNFNKVSMNVTAGGAAHADELGYIFDRDDLTEVPTEEDQRVIDQITMMWTNFAKYSTPIPETSDLLPVEWPSLTAETYNYVNIGSNLTTGTRPLNQRMAYWDLFFQHNQEYLRHTDRYSDSSAVTNVITFHLVYLLGILYMI